MNADAVLGGSGAGWFAWPVSGASLRVDRDNVMQVIRITLDEAERYREKLKTYLGGMIVTSPADDPVDQAAQRLLNWRLWKAPDSYYAQCLAYARGLDELAEQLAEAARTYGHTEEVVTALFPEPTRDRVGGDHYVV